MAQETSVLPLPLPQELLREIEGWLDPLTLYLHKKLGPIDQNEYRELIAGAFLTDNLSAIKQLQARLDEVTFYYIQDKNSFSLSFEPLFIVSEEMEALVQTIGMAQQSYMKDRLYLLEKDPQRIIDLVIKNLGIYWMHKVSVWFTDQAARFILPSVLALEKLTPNHRILAIAARNGNFIMCEKLAECFLELELSEDAPDEELEEIDPEYGEDWCTDGGDGWGDELKVGQILPDSYAEALKYNHKRIRKLIFNTALKTDAPVLWGKMMVAAVTYGSINDAEIILERDPEALNQAIHRSFNSFSTGDGHETDVVHDLLEKGDIEMVSWLMSRVEHRNKLFRNIQTYSLAFGRFELFETAKNLGFGRDPTASAFGTAIKNGRIDVVRWILENTGLQLNDEIEEPEDDDWEFDDGHMQEVDILVALLGDQFDMVRFLVLEMDMRFPEIRTYRQRDWNQRHVDLGLELGHVFDDKDKSARPDLFGELK